MPKAAKPKKTASDSAQDIEVSARVRDFLSSHPDVVEKRMFGGRAFLVREKMCVCTGKGRLLCRVDPNEFAKFTSEDGVTAMVMRGKALAGYLEVPYENVRTKAALSKWVKRCLSFNETL